MCNLYIMGRNHVKIGNTLPKASTFARTRESGAWEMCDVVQGFACLLVPQSWCVEASTWTTILGAT